jgi:hypothetical protein
MLAAHSSAASMLLAFAAAWASVIPDRSRAALMRSQNVAGVLSATEGRTAAATPAAMASRRDSTVDMAGS